MSTIPDTFTISEAGDSITCHACGLTSYSPRDIALHFCHACQIYHDHTHPPARADWIGQRQAERSRLAKTLATFTDQETIPLLNGRTVYHVPRLYVAMFGIKAWQLHDLATRFHWKTEPEP